MTKPQPWFRIEAAVVKVGLGPLYGAATASERDGPSYRECRESWCIEGGLVKPWVAAEPCTYRIEIQPVGGSRLRSEVSGRHEVGRLHDRSYRSKLQLAHQLAVNIISFSGNGIRSLN